MDDPATLSVQVHKNCRLLYEICGDTAAKKTHNVILVTTMWGATETKIEVGAKINRLTRAEDGWTIIEQATKRKKKGALLLQQELVDEGRRLKDTRAGKTLFTSLNNLTMKREQLLQEIEKEMEVPNNPEFKKLRSRYEEIKWELGEAKKDVERMEDWDREQEFTVVSCCILVPDYCQI
jgi:hypothetical protein